MSQLVRFCCKFPFIISYLTAVLSKFHNGDDSTAVCVEAHIAACNVHCRKGYLERYILTLVQAPIPRTRLLASFSQTPGFSLRPA